jgi:hypothetical protein
MMTTTTAWRSAHLRDCKASVADMVLTVDLLGFVVDAALSPAAVAKLRSSSSWSEVAVKAAPAHVETPQALLPLTPAPIVEPLAPVAVEPIIAASAKADVEPQPPVASAEPRKGKRKWQ